MAVFYKYEYRNKRKNIHPWLAWQQKLEDKRVRLSRGEQARRRAASTSTGPPPSPGRRSRGRRGGARSSCWFCSSQGRCLDFKPNMVDIVKTTKSSSQGLQAFYRNFEPKIWMVSAYIHSYIHMIIRNGSIILNQEYAQSDAERARHHAYLHQNLHKQWRK